MNSRHLNILFPQWQGCGQDMSTYLGCMDIKNNYLQNIRFDEVDVASHLGVTHDGIIGYSCIYEQLRQVKQIISQNSPDTIFTIGGGCDADLIPLTYISKKYGNSFSVLWIDAHADLHISKTSESHLFHGMPLRTALGEGEKDVTNLLDSKIIPSQIIMIGTRDMEEAEELFIKNNRIPIISCEEIENGLQSVIEAVRLNGLKKIYLHIDFDVIEPAEFPYVTVPANGGLKIKTIRGFLKRLQCDFEIIGMGIFEYNGNDNNHNFLLEELIQIGACSVSAKGCTQ